jgi:DNA repair protein RecN (Recombination protein N)
LQRLSRTIQRVLHTLRIKNLALVADLTLDLPEGLSVLTGETGAGKSIILGAVNLLLGQRADRTLIRSGADSCTVEAVFDIRRLKAPLREFLESNGLEPCEDHALTLKRTFTAAGSNRQFVNGTPTSLSVLASLGEWLVDLHGPHDHQSLLYPARQLDILDAFGGLENTRNEFATLLQTRAKVLEEKHQLILDDMTYARELDLLRFQVEEITASRLVAGEDITLAEEHHRASNAARLLEQCQSALELLSESDTAILSQTGQLGRTLHELKRLDPSTEILLELHESTLELMRELQHELSRYRDRIQVDPERLAELEERLNLIQSLKRKHGPHLEDVLEYGEKARARLAILNSRDAEVTRLNQALAAVHKQILDAGKRLSTARAALRVKLANAVTSDLQELGFKQSHFDVVLAPNLPDMVINEQTKLNASGFDQIEFQFAPNPGEPPRPLRAIASSGEMARVMLAIKSVLARVDDVPVLIFDEVDANVGGETARAVGARMKQIGRNHQVLCISHLAPVAAQAQTHFLVSKSTRAGRTESHIEALDDHSRINELARMLGGGGDAAVQLAESLLKS